MYCFPFLFLGVVVLCLSSVLQLRAAVPWTWCFVLCRTASCVAEESVGDKVTSL